MRVFVALAVLAGGCEFAPEDVAGAPSGDVGDAGVETRAGDAYLAGGSDAREGQAWDADADRPGAELDAAPGDPVCPSCGDGECASYESCRTCASDCGDCDLCGDGVCSAGESTTSCATDCAPTIPSHCGNGACGGNERCDLCAEDCGACRGCGDGRCDADEDCATDCGGAACVSP